MYIIIMIYRQPTYLMMYMICNTVFYHSYNITQTSSHFTTAVL